MSKLLIIVRKIRTGIIEQGFISLLNFGMVILLSRMLAPGEFAEYVILFAGISLAFSISLGLWSNPVLVFLPTKYSESKVSYLLIISTGNFISNILICLIIFGTIDLFVRDITFFIIILSTVVAWVWSQYEILRKAYYSINQIKLLAIGSTILTLVFIVGNTLIYFVGNLDTFRALFVLFLGYFISLIFILSTSKWRKQEKRKTNKIDVLKNHWEFSKWPVGGMIGYWIASQGYFIFAAFFLNDLQLGGLRAAMNLLGILSVLYTLFENSITPIASQLFNNNGKIELNSYIANIYKKMFMPLLGVILVTGVLSFYLFEFIYGDKYFESRNLVIIFALYQFALGMNRPVVIALRAQLKTKSFFWGHISAASISITIGLFLVKAYESFGGALGILLSGLVFTLIITYSYYDTTIKQQS
ncbi:hypothetical protein [Bacillus sp. Cs-700]|uniref:lipopolysaccharide biosynthesis protein n=1 Tax=Bacillus sp. Cs-700 TaxID=2589818 RepID=UPI001409B0F5|nr:hypothetical protein [Bacillus sp. Cs-700]